MKLLIIDCSGSGAGLDLALRSMNYGHDVRVFMRKNMDGSKCESGDGGLIHKVSNWEQHMNWADLIFCTDNLYYIHQLERYRDKGYPIIGPSIDTNRWEQDRAHGSDIMEKAGIEIIPSKRFNNYDDAIAYVIKTNKRYVSKPIGDGEKAMSYVSKSPADMVYMLQKWKKKNSYKGEDFILQEFHAGYEFAVGAWFGPGGFNKAICESWEHKKLMNDDLGVATGEQGTIVRYVEESKLFDKVLAPLEGFLHGLGYTGYIDVNCIIDEKDGTPWPLEFTMRPGWPLFQIQQRLHKGDPIQWMADLLEGKDTLKVSKDMACGVVISIPDYPYSHVTKKENSGYPLWGITPDDACDMIHLSEVQWGKAPAMDGEKLKMDVPMYVTAGDYVCIVSGTGKTVKDAHDECYKNIKKKIEIPNSIMYRTDIGLKLEKQIPKLQKFGYAEGAEFGG